MGRNGTILMPPPRKYQDWILRACEIYFTLIEALPRAVLRWWLRRPQFRRTDSEWRATEAACQRGNR